MHTVRVFPVKSLYPLTQLVDSDGFQLLGWLLFKVPSSHLSVDSISELEALLFPPLATNRSRTEGGGDGGRVQGVEREAGPRRGEWGGAGPLHPRLVDHLIEFVLCDVRIWARGSLPVQKAHIALLLRAHKAAIVTLPLGSPPLAVISTRLILEALRETGKRMPSHSSELRAVRKRIVRLAAETEPADTEIQALVTQVRRGGMWCTLHLSRG